MTRGSLWAATLLTVSCASRLHLPDRPICAPDATRATLCIYRNNFSLRMPDAMVSVDGFEVIRLSNDEWVEITVSPGEHALSADADGFTSSLLSRIYQLSAGTLRFVRVYVGQGGGWGAGPVVVLQEPDELAAREAISRDCRPGPRVSFTIPR